MYSTMSTREPCKRRKIICIGPCKDDHSERNSSPLLDCYALIGSFEVQSVSFSIDKGLLLVSLQFDELYRETLDGYDSICWAGVTMVLEIIEKVTTGNDVAEKVCFSSGKIGVPPMRTLGIRPSVHIQPNTTYEIRAKVATSFPNRVCVYHPYNHVKTHKLCDGTTITFDKNYSIIRSLQFESV